MRVPALIAGLMLAFAAPAWAAERVPIVGTIVSLVPPDGFAEGTAEAGLVNAEGAQIRAFRMPDAYLFEDGMAGDDRLAPFLGAEGFAGTAAPEQLKADGKIVFVEEGTLGDGRRMWIAVFNASPNAAVTFTEPAGGTLFDRDAVLAVLDSMRLTKTEERGDGAVILGLFLPLTAPFADVDAGGGIVENATLSLTEEKGRDRGAPHLDLFFPAVISEALDLEGLAAKYLEIDVKEGTSAPATLAGAPAIRQQGRFFIGSREALGVGYVAVIGGQTIVLFGRGPEAKMTDEVIAAVDASAAGLTRYVPE